MTLPSLCQHERGSCGACCGLYNFVDRGQKAEHARLMRRTERVAAAWPHVDELAEARDELLALEREGVLFATVKVCPFAGYVEEGRVGCLLHPTRHPEGEDLRDLAVYPKEVCRDHFCGPHEWLRPIEAALARCAEGTGYGLVVTDAGLVKAVRALLEEQLGRPLAERDVERGQQALAALWRELLAWPFRDKDPHRFGGFYVVGDEAVERTLPGCLAGLAVPASAAARTVLDGLGTKVTSEDEARGALAHLSRLLREAAAAL
jgi:hypothetical protein